MTYESVMIYSGTKGQIVEVAERTAGAANDWYENDLVRGDGLGYVKIATAAKILGIAQSRATGVAYTALDVELLNPATIYVIRGPSGSTPSQAFVHESFDLNFDKGADGGHYVDTSSTDGEVTIVGIYPGEDSVTGGRYLVRFNASIFAESGV